MRGEGAVSRLLVLPHEAAIAEHIGAEYGGELAFQYPPPEYAPDYSTGPSIKAMCALSSSFVTPVCIPGAMVKVGAGRTT